MNKMVGRFYVHPLSGNDGRGAILIGVGDMATLKNGHVIEVSEDIFGDLSVSDLGPSEIAGDPKFQDICVSKLLAEAQGKHLTPVKK